MGNIWWKSRRRRLLAKQRSYMDDYKSGHIVWWECYTSFSALSLSCYIYDDSQHSETKVGRLVTRKLVRKAQGGKCEKVLGDMPHPLFFIPSYPHVSLITSSSYLAIANTISSFVHTLKHLLSNKPETNCSVPRSTISNNCSFARN